LTGISKLSELVGAPAGISSLGGTTRGTAARLTCGILQASGCTGVAGVTKFDVGVGAGASKNAGAAAAIRFLESPERPAAPSPNSGEKNEAGTTEPEGAKYPFGCGAFGPRPMADCGPRLDRSCGLADALCDGTGTGVGIGFGAGVLVGPGGLTDGLVAGVVGPALCGTVDPNPNGSRLAGTLGSELVGWPGGTTNSAGSVCVNGLGTP
jgi:hypothetical protein